MLPLLRAEIRRLTGRRGSFYGPLAVTAVGLLIAILVDDPVDGGQALDHLATVGRYVGLLGVVVMGALAGSYDTANGTMRYLVLTGVPRWKLALVRIPGIMIAVLPLALLIMVVGVLVASGNSAGGPTGTQALDALWAVLSTLWVWSLVSVAIGMLLRSNGPAIAVAVVLFFGGTLITGLVGAYISETVANYLLPAVFVQVSELHHPNGDFTLVLGAAFAVLAVWLLVLVGAATLRVQRDEY